MGDVCGYTQTWTVTATDACGITAECEVTYTWIEDTEPPVFTDCPDPSELPIYLGCLTGGPDEFDAIALAGTVTDNCTYTLSADGGEISSYNKVCSGFIQTWIVTATDVCGNTAECVVSICWTEDEEPPVFTDCPTEPINLGCVVAGPVESDVLTAAGNITDDCSLESVVAIQGRIVSCSVCGDDCNVIQTWTVIAMICVAIHLNVSDLYLE